MTHKIAILGASGYTGAELIRLIATHPSMEITALSADRKAGMQMGDVFPHLRHLSLPKLVKIDEIDFLTPASSSAQQTVKAEEKKECQEKSEPKENLALHSANSISTAGDEANSTNEPEASQEISMEDTFEDNDCTFAVKKPRHKGARKTREQTELLLSYFHMYKGVWEQKKFQKLIELTGFTKS